MTLATALADRVIFRTITETAAVRILEAYGSYLTDFVDDIEDVGGVYEPASIDAGRLYRFLGY